MFNARGDGSYFLWGPEITKLHFADSKKINGTYNGIQTHTLLQTCVP